MALNTLVIVNKKNSDKGPDLKIHTWFNEF